MTSKQKKVLYRIITSTALIVAVSVLCYFVDINIWIQIPLYLIPYFIIGYDILKKAVKGIINRQIFDENFLMAVATVGAILLGDFREGVAVMLFYQIGELFQSLAVGKSRKNISALMDIRPDYANILVDGEIEKVDPDDVEVGTEIIVNPGEKIPIDGVIIEGNTTLDTSALTGESVPREALTGDEVISGSINMSGVITVRTTKEFEESTVSKILELVENSSMKKSRSENFITKFAKYYTPVVCYSALALAVCVPVIRLILGTSPQWQQWIIRALTFLVISCPCALVISVPLSFFGGIGCASSNGILVKGSNYLEILSSTKYIVFDKTGTLTKGVFEVSELTPANGFTKEELLRYAAYAESGSNHPISISLKKAFGEKIDIQKVSDVKEIAGHGVYAKVEDHEVYAGNEEVEEHEVYAGNEVVEDHKVYAGNEKVEDHEVYAGNEKLMKAHNIKYIADKNCGTVVYVAVDNEFAGSITISDVIKPSAKSSISELKKNGIKESIMLTGDRKEVAESVAKEIGVDTVRSELLPDEKVLEVEKLLDKKGVKEKLAFVGDGINDAPVLTRADIGIAMGALGSDAAIEAADIVLMDDDPSKIALAMKISTRTLKIVKQNIVFALLVKLVCLVLGALGIAGMWLAIFADVGVMVIAVLNATRALKIRL